MSTAHKSTASTVVFDGHKYRRDSLFQSATGYTNGPGYLSRYSDLLRAGRSGDRIPVGARFSAPFQTGPAAHPASCTMGSEYLPGVKRTGSGVDHPHPSSAVVKEIVELYLYSPFGPSWPVLGRTLPLLHRLGTTFSPKTCSHKCHCRCVSTHTVHSAAIAVLRPTNLLESEAGC